MGGASSIRIIRSDKRFKSRNIRTNSGAGTNICSAITLQDLTEQPYLNTSFIDSVAPTGGTAPYNLSVTSGSLLTGQNLNAATGLIFGAPTIFGQTATFTIGGTDANGCPVTPKTYTLQTWAAFSTTSSQNFDGNNNPMIINVSGMPNLYGVGINLYSTILNASKVNVSQVVVALLDPDGTAFPFILTGNPGGSNFTNTQLADGFPSISTGVAPYTGKWQQQSGLSYNSNFTSTTAIPSINGSWVAYVQDATNLEGSMDSVTLVFKPLPNFSATNITIVNGVNTIPITVSGIQTPYSAQQLFDLILNITCADLSQLSDILLSDPSNNACGLVLSGCESLAGANLTNTMFVNQVTSPGSFGIGVGAAPYTGIWIDASSCTPTLGFDGTFSGITNGTWNLIIINNGSSCTLNLATLTFNF